jgi:hypothetical protein
MATVAYSMIAAGIIGGLVAAPFGWIDWFAFPGVHGEVGRILAWRRKCNGAVAFRSKLVAAT